MTALLTNEYRPFSLAVIGFAGGAACGCDFSCPRTAPETAINRANTKQSLFFTRYLSEKSCHISIWEGRITIWALSGEKSPFHSKWPPLRGTLNVIACECRHH